MHARGQHVGKEDPITNCECPTPLTSTNETGCAVLGEPLPGPISSTEARAALRHDVQWEAFDADIG